MKDKKHIITVAVIIVFVIIIGFVARYIIKPESFGEHGHYRWNAVSELQKQQIVNQNINTCAECHADVYQLHEKDAHFSVPCVDCHGAGNLHVLYHNGGDSAKQITKEQASLPKEYKLEGCLFCHKKLKARPSDFPQINQEEHYKFLNVPDLKTKCVECHSPHQPLFMLTSVRDARIHPIVYRCTECHDKKPEKSFKEVTDHPAIFECNDCHSSIVKSFNERPHQKYIECRTCHLYHKENDNTGRIYKNGNAKFCLLCHEKKPFKDEKYPPKIDWPTHIGNSKIIPKRDEKICLNCHADRIHAMDVNFRENPHSKNWVPEHKNFVAGQIEVCKGCHSTNDCSNCHSKTKPASHSQNWRKQHPSFGAKNQSSCETCHKAGACMNCHKIPMPHPKGFDETHKDVVSQKGNGLCANCHKEEFCKQCH
jgi:hypothetical protein